LGKKTSFGGFNLINLYKNVCEFRESLDKKIKNFKQLGAIFLLHGRYI
jgi:hypothetical protein